MLAVCSCPLVFVAVARVKVTRLGHCLFVGDKKLVMAVETDVHAADALCN